MVRISDDEAAGIGQTLTQIGAGGFGSILDTVTDKVRTAVGREYDGLGHYTEDGGATWRNANDGSLYQEPVAPYNPGPGSYNLGGAGLNVYPTAGAGTQWVDNGTAGGKYVDPWGNESYDGGNTWMSPGEIAAGVGAPAFAPDWMVNPEPPEPTYVMPEGPGNPWASTEFDPDRIDDLRTALRRRGQYVPDDASPWDLFALASGEAVPIGDGSRGQGLRDFGSSAGTAAMDIIGAPQKYVGGPLAQIAIQNPWETLGTALNPIGGIQQIGVQAALNPRDAVETYQEGYQANQDFLNDPGVNPFIREGYRTLTDPLTYLGPGAAKAIIPEGGKAAGIARGLIDQGGVPAVLGANLGAVAGSTETAGDIPFFGEQPAWLRGLEAGAIGGLGAAGASAGARKAAGALLDDTMELPPSIRRPRIARPADLSEYPPDIARQIEPGPAIPQIAGGADEDITKAFLSGAARQGDDVPTAPFPVDETPAAPREALPANAPADDVLAAVRSGKATDAETAAAVRRGVVTPDEVEAAVLSRENTDTVVTKVRDAIQREYDYRASGQADEAIRAGRRQQAEGIRGAIGGMTGDFETDAAAIRASTKTGKMLPPAEPIALSDADMGALLQQAVDFYGDDVFKVRRMPEVLSKLKNGEHLQPAEIKALAEVYGEELADTIRKTNASRIKTTATLTAEDMVEIERRGAIDGRKAARLEVTAQRTHQLADDLDKQARMNPTNARLKKAAEDTRARAIQMENDADRLMAERVRKTEAKLREKAAAQAERDAQREQAGVARAQELQDARDIKAANKAANKARLDTAEQVMVKAADVVAKLDVGDELKSQILDSIDLSVKNANLVLDGMGDSAPGIIRKLYAGFTGEVTDSWTSHLLEQEAYLRHAIEGQGIDGQVAKKIARLVRDAEVKARYGDAVPEWVTNSLKEAQTDYKGTGLIRGMAEVSQEIKNTQFGIGDLAVIAQQGAKAAMTNTAQIAAGLTNRILNRMHLGLDPALADSGLGKRIVYQLDGVAKTSHAITDLTNEKTIFSNLGRPGQLLDRKFIVPVTKRITDLQYNLILGNLRDLIHEGNLVLAHVAGDDITDPVVRHRAAEWANAATGAGKLAQKSQRALTEKALLLTPSMRRAQAQQIGQVARGLSSGSRIDRILAASTIISTVGTGLAVGKLLNDWVGMDAFEFDPTKPDFGKITLADGTVMNPFSQEQIAKAFARSLRTLVEDGVSEDDLKPIAKEWGKLMVSSASPAAQYMLSAIGGVGIDETGYHWGDLNTGKGLKERFLSGAPIPPLFSSIREEGLSPIRTPLEALGFNAYPESEYDALDRDVRRDSKYGGRGYSDLSPSEKAEAQAKYGKLPPFGPEGEEAAAQLQVLTDQQKNSDAARTAGQLTPEQWRRDYSERKQELAIRNDQIYSKLNLETKDPVLRQYYASIDSAKGADGKIDWSKVDAYIASLPQPQQDYITANTGLVKIQTSETNQFKQDYDAIKASGYFQRTDKTWEAMADTFGIDDPDYYHWKDQQVAETLSMIGGTKEQPGKLAQAESIVSKLPAVKFMEESVSGWKKQWAVENPEEAYKAWKYGYYDPVKEIKTYLQGKFE